MSPTTHDRLFAALLGVGIGFYFCAINTYSTRSAYQSGQRDAIARLQCGYYDNAVCRDYTIDRTSILKSDTCKQNGGVLRWCPFVPTPSRSPALPPSDVGAA